MGWVEVGGVGGAYTCQKCERTNCGLRSAVKRKITIAIRTDDDYSNFPICSTYIHMHTHTHTDTHTEGVWRVVVGQHRHDDAKLK